FPIKSETPPPRPFWKDPVIVIGTAIPATILIVFSGYLYHERSEREFHGRVSSLKAEADRLAGAGKSRAAFEKYESLLAIVGDSRSVDSQVRADVEDAKRARDRLYPIVDADLEREKLARFEAAEAERLRKEYEDKIAEEKAETERLAKFTANVSGGAWVV